MIGYFEFEMILWSQSSKYTKQSMKIQFSVEFLFEKRCGAFINTLDHVGSLQLFRLRHDGPENLLPRWTDDDKNTPPIRGQSILILVLFFSIRTHVRFFVVSKRFFSTKFYAFSMVRSYFTLPAFDPCVLAELPYFQNQNET